MDKHNFEVIIVGGSYSGLAAGMALGRSLRRVLIIDSGKPCNQSAPHSHNFLTQDGKTPMEIFTLAREQVESYRSVVYFNALATYGVKTIGGFEIQTSSGETFTTKKLIFATGIRDVMSTIEGYEACWGISVIHCPYCHGYEVKNETTGILGNGDYGFEFAALISNWTKDLTLFTNGPSTLTNEQAEKIKSHHIKIVETEIAKLEHTNGYLEKIVFKDSTTFSLSAMYTRNLFEHHCKIPEALGCLITEEGYIDTNTSQKTTVPEIFACGDNTSRIRTLANAVAMGTMAGMMVNKEMVLEGF